MNEIQQIEDGIVAVSGLHETYREDLHVTIRVARDFYDFLVKYGESPSGEQIDYIAGTIRSGMDEFYLLANGCRSIVRDNDTWKFDPHEHWDFSALRERFIRGFEHLADPDVSAADKLASLFALTHFELIFLARHFPSAIFAERPSDLMTINESLQSIKKMIGGKASWTREDS
jgi:hypothetical protein